MGNALRSHEDLIHVRGWNKDQISSVLDLLRGQNCVYSVTRDEFLRYFGGRNREAVAVFRDLDTDGDGRVDVFEVFVTIAIWSGTSWEEKQDILFKLFDMMQKGFLKVDEVGLLATSLLQTLKKFVKLEEEFTDPAFVRGWVQKAVPVGDSKVNADAFRSWVKNCEPFEQLRGLVESHAARAQPDTNESRMRQRIGVIDTHSTTLIERIEQLQDKLPDFAESCVDYVSALGRRKRWDFVIQQLREVVMKLSKTSEQLHSKMSTLEQLLHEDEVTGGTASLVDPAKRFRQESMLLSLDQMRDSSAMDYREAVDLLRRLVDLTQPGDTTGMGVSELLGEGIGMSSEDRSGVPEPVGLVPTRVVENRTTMQQLLDDMASDCEDGRLFGRSAEAATSRPCSPGAPALPMGTAMQTQPPAAGAGGSESEPTLVAIADFEAPPSHEAQMLKLDVGDVVIVLGQDGRGWWYGRKQSNNNEGWFPPSYVQLKPAHFTSAAS